MFKGLLIICETFSQSAKKVFAKINKLSQSVRSMSLTMDIVKTNLHTQMKFQKNRGHPKENLELLFL